MAPPIGEGMEAGEGGRGQSSMLTTGPTATGSTFTHGLHHICDLDELQAETITSVPSAWCRGESWGCCREPGICRRSNKVYDPMKILEVEPRKSTLHLLPPSTLLPWSTPAPHQGNCLASSAKVSPAEYKSSL